MRKFLSPLLLMGILTSLQVGAQVADVSRITAAVDQHYNHLKSFKADFTETYSGNGISRTESGTLWLKKPGKMLWQYAEPHPKVFVTDGKTAYFYVPGELQARKTPLKKLDDFRSPLRYLLGNTKLSKEFPGLQIVPGPPGTTTLAGVPKGMEDRISDVLLTIQNSRITGIRITQLDSSTTDFQFRNIQENVQVSDAKFRPDVPAGVQWIESEDLNPD
ncbi:MAG: outer membrane lipoprotein carrier protein LolA [Acidobacteriaceae bacterium]